MPNNNVFNTDSDPLYMEQTNTFTNPGIESAQEWQAAANGILFIANTSGSISASQNLLLQVSNSGARTMYVSRIAGSITTSGATLTVMRGGTFTGTAVTPVNYNFGSSVTSAMTAQRATATVAGSPVTLISSILAAGPFTSDFNGRIIVPPGSVITVSVGVGSATASANISWWEY